MHINGIGLIRRFDDAEIGRSYSLRDIHKGAGIGTTWYVFAHQHRDMEGSRRVRGDILVTPSAMAEFVMRSRSIPTMVKLLAVRRLLEEEPGLLPADFVEPQAF